MTPESDNVAERIDHRTESSIEVPLIAPFGAEFVLLSQWKASCVIFKEPSVADIVADQRSRPSIVSIELGISVFVSRNLDPMYRFLTPLRSPMPSDTRSNRPSALT